MNKRKTLRMTSILLALMMFFGMVSVLLVPAGVAGAADAQVDITIDDTTATEYDSSNVIVLDDKLDDKTYTLKVSKLLWGNDNSDFVNVKMVLRDWDEKEIAGYTSANPMTMTPSITEAGMYTCTFKADKIAYSAYKPGQTGLYTMELRRYYANGTMDQVALKVGAFWLAQKMANTSVSGQISEITTGKMAENVDELYIGPAAKFEYDSTKGPLAAKSIVSNWSPISGTSLRILDPINNGFIKVFDKIDSSSKYTYTVPSNATHETELEFMGIVIDPGAYRNCWAVDYAYDGTTNDYTEGTIDAKGPEIGNIILQSNTKLDWLWDDFVIRSSNNGTAGDAGKYAEIDEFGSGTRDMNQVEVDEITDADSGFVLNTTDNQPSDAYVKFVNPFNSNVFVGSGTSVGTDNTSLSYRIASATTTSSYYRNEKNQSTTYLFNLTSPNPNTTGNTTFYDRYLLGKRYEVRVVAEDAVGNVAEKSYKVVDFYADDYTKIEEIRVEQQNVLEMYVGQTINYEDVLLNGVKVAINSDASFPDNYVWFSNNDTATLKLFDFDYDAKTITAKAAGEGRIYVSPWYNYRNETAFPNADKNGYMAVIVHAQPTVSSLTLSSSKLALAVGAEHKLTATIVPAGVTATWSSTDTAVATVDQNGNVKAVAAGTTTVSVAAGGKYAVCTVTVSDATVIPDPDPPAEDLKGWVDEGNNRYYYVDNQKVVGWRKIDGSWYFFDYTSAAMRANGWLKEGGKWYYLNSNGTMKSAEWFKDNNGKWYWLKANGAMAAGWEKINGTWYYFNASGAMQTGWVNVRGIWYYMKSSGAMAEGWLQDGGSWYYLTPGGGAMVTGRVTINGRASNFATSGRWLGYV